MIIENLFKSVQWSGCLYTLFSPLLCGIFSCRLRGKYLGSNIVLYLCACYEPWATSEAMGYIRLSRMFLNLCYEADVFILSTCTSCMVEFIIHFQENIRGAIMFCICVLATSQLIRVYIRLSRICLRQAGVLLASYQR